MRLAFDDKRLNKVGVLGLGVLDPPVRFPCGEPRLRWRTLRELAHGGRSRRRCIWLSVAADVRVDESLPLRGEACVRPCWVHPLQHPAAGLLAGFLKSYHPPAHKPQVRPCNAVECVPACLPVGGALEHIPLERRLLTEHVPAAYSKQPRLRRHGVARRQQCAQPLPQSSRVVHALGLPLDDGLHRSALLGVDAAGEPDRLVSASVRV